MLTFLGTGFYSYSRGIFLPALAEELADGSRFAISVGFSMAAATSALLAFWVGRLVDRGSAKRFLLFGIAATTLGYVLLSQITALWQFYLVIGLCMGVAVTCMGNLVWHRTIISWFDHWRGRAISLGVLGASLAGVVMPPLVTELVGTIGWRQSYLVFGLLIAVVLVPLVWVLLRDRPEEIGEVRDGRAYVAAHADEVVELPEETRAWRVGELLRSPAFWCIGLIFGSMTCVYLAVMLHLFGHLTDLNIAPERAAYVLSFMALFAALGKPLVGWLADAFGARVTIWLALVVQALGLAAFSVADGFTGAMLSGLLYGLGYAGMSPLRTFAISVSMGSASFGNANGVLRLVELPFVLSASPLAGYIYDSTGSYALAFQILAGLMLVACLGVFSLRAGGARERRRRKAQIDARIEQQQRLAQQSQQQ
ncbi:MAG: MFS transporter [Pseudomonadota bacterium]